MPLKFILFLCVLFFTEIVQAQKLSISGVIQDENSELFPGVQIDLLNDQNKAIQSERSNLKGEFTFYLNRQGQYSLTIQFLGYENDTINLLLKDSSIILKPIKLKITSKNLSEVVVKEKKPIGAVINDTLQFNASSFKVMKDATADELIEKMPSVTKDQGSIKSQGEEVKQVLVDGKPFFGTDPNLSLKNLPAELIDKIQIFDQLSEQSQFTGINDGNTVKTINIVTKSGLNNGQFGKLYSGFGLPDQNDNDEFRYQLGGNFNYFNGDRKISLIGMSNNINIQNFSIDDILGAMGSNNNQRGRGNFGGPPRMGNDSRRDSRNNSSGPGDFLVPQTGGITTTHALGINYTDKLGSKLDINFSYFYNQTRNKTINELSRQYFQADTTNQNYFESNTSTSNNLNHRINGRLEYKIDSSNSIILRPRITFQTNTSKGNSHSLTILNGESINETTNENQFDSDGYNFSNSLLYRHKFRKPGRTISLDINANYAPKDDQSFQLSFTQYKENNQLINDTLNQRRTNDYNKWGFNSNIEYTEPINPLHSLSLNYRYNIGSDKPNLETYDVTFNQTEPDTLNTDLSNRFDSKNSSHQIGVGYQFNKEQQWYISVRSSWQYSHLENQETFPGHLNLQKNFYNILPSLYLRYNISKSKNLNISYRSNTQIPTSTQLQYVLNNSNPVQLSIGNPDLRQSVSHNFNFRFSSNNSDASMFYLMLGGSYTTDYITNHLYIQNRNLPIFNEFKIAPGSQLTIPENTSSSTQLRSFLSYTIPISLIKCNLTFDGSYVYTESPGLLDTMKFNTYQQFSTFGLSLTSNISQKFDFNIQFRPSYNTYKSADTKDNYFILDQRVKFNWQFTNKNIIRIEFNSKINQDLSRQFDQNIYLLNIAIGRKIFKNERGEIAIGVNDIFNENESIQRLVSEYYLEDSKNNTIQRFFMVSFTYNIRNYNSGKKPTGTNFQDSDRMRRWDR
jgi:hypothetical protein